MLGDNILLFGSSYMAEEYLKVLQNLGSHVAVIGRNEEKAKNLAQKYGQVGHGEGISALDEINCDEVDLAIIATSIESLKDVTIACIDKRIKNILLEKPGALNLSELKSIKRKIKSNVNIWIAYNRRYYSSVLKLRQISAEEGIQGCFFDFTDREKDVLSDENSPVVREKWGFANSSHVIDAAFFLIGKPVEISCKKSGSLGNHSSGSTFVGHGKTQKSLFSYFATWAGGGRWNVELSTDKGRYKLSPLEKLSFCKKNQFDWVDIALDNKEDLDFKPGVKRMVESVLKKENVLLPTLDEQIEFCKIMNKIFGYSD